MRAAGPILLSFALAACTPRQSASEQTLRLHGLEPVNVTAADWWFGPCEWTEPYTARFLARTRYGLQAGVICATGELAEGTRLRAIQSIPRERDPALTEAGR